MVVCDDPLDAGSLPWLVARVTGEAPLDVLHALLNTLWILGIMTDLKLQAFIMQLESLILEQVVLPACRCAQLLLCSFLVMKRKRWKPLLPAHAC